MPGSRRPHEAVNHGCALTSCKPFGSGFAVEPSSAGPLCQSGLLDGRRPMFEFGRELRRLFGGPKASFPSKDGLTGGDGALLELLDLRMLKAEAKGSDVAAGRIGARDRPRRLLEAA